MLSNKIKFLFSLILFSTNLLFSEGFVAGTLVKTSLGYKPIEQLEENDEVIGYDLKQNCTSKKILKTFSNISSEITTIIIDNNTIIRTASDHKFYFPFGENDWVEAKDIKPGNILYRACSGYSLVKVVFHEKEKFPVYDISVEDHKNFCITENDILVHNWVIAIPLLGGIGAIITAIGRGLLNVIAEKVGEEVTRKKRSDYNNNFSGYYNGAAAGGGDPEDPRKNGQSITGSPKNDRNDDNERKNNPRKQDSPIWKQAKSTSKNYKLGKDPLTGKAEKWQWDYTHNDIEAYNKRTGEHLGSRDPISGKLYKPKKDGRFLKE